MDPIAWHCDVFSDLLVRCWENEYFLYNPHTGHTHILNDLSWSLLSACSTTQQEEDHLLEVLAGYHSVGGLEELAETLDIHLDHLLQLGLLKPIEQHGLH